MIYRIIMKDGADPVRVAGPKAAVAMARELERVGSPVLRIEHDKDGQTQTYSVGELEQSARA